MSSSSPGLPSPSAFFPRKASGALRSGSRAAQVPEGAITGFATASSLIQSRRLSLSVEEFPTEQEAKRQRGSLAEVDANTRPSPKKPAKRPTIRAPKPKDDEPRSKRPRKRDTGIRDNDYSNVPTSDCPLATTELNEAQFPAADNIEQVDFPVPKSTPSKPRKPRAPKAKSETQTKLKRGRITKPGSRSIAPNNINISQDSVAEAKSTGAVSERFPPKQPTGITLDRDTQTVNIESPPMIEDLGKEGMNNSINSTQYPHSNVIEGTLKKAKSTITVEEAPTSEGALKRRTNWTPVKDTEPTETEDIGSVKKETQSPSPLCAKDSFANRLVDYAYSENMEPNSAAVPVKFTSGEVLTKRRRIELIGFTNQVTEATEATVATLPEKAKAPKKKARTITDLVTAQYMNREAELIVPATTNNFFATRVNDGHPDIVSAYASDSVPIKPARQKATRQKSSREDTKQGKVATKSKAKPKLAAAKLLSPESAARKMNKQDILFGTSSQLAREEAPSVIREIQQAIRESEAEVPAHSKNAFENSDRVENLRHSTSLSLAKANRGLWAAAARDFGNNLLAVEESLYLPPTPSTNKPNSISQERCRPEIVNSDQSCEDFIPITDKLKTDIVDIKKSKSFAAQPQTKILTDLYAFSDIDKFENITSRMPVEHSGFLDIEEFRQDCTSPSHDRNFVSAAYDSTIKESAILPSTDGRLSPGIVMAALTKTGACSKPAKNIPTITVRDESSKQPAMDTQYALSKKPRGRPRKTILSDPPPLLPKNLKDAKKCSEPSQISNPAPNTPKKSIAQLKFTHVDEISDSESEPTPSPPRVPVYCSTSPPLELHSSQPSSRILPPATTTSLAWTTARLTLFPQITAVVKNAPRGADPSNPSWYEKMLMYDPIVLEDLTTWLNAQGLRVLGRAPVIKGNRKGKGKKRVSGPTNYRDEEVKVIEKELEPWMVQKWCEEKSVCCLWREGLRGGVKSRY